MQALAVTSDLRVWAFTICVEEASKGVQDFMPIYKACSEQDSPPLHRNTANILAVCPEINQPTEVKQDNTHRYSRLRAKCQENLVYKLVWTDSDSVGLRQWLNGHSYAVESHRRAAL